MIPALGAEDVSLPPDIHQDFLAGGIFESGTGRTDLNDVQVGGSSISLADKDIVAGIVGYLHPAGEGGHGSVGDPAALGRAGDGRNEPG